MKNKKLEVKIEEKKGVQLSNREYLEIEFKLEMKVKERKKINLDGLEMKVKQKEKNDKLNIKELVKIKNILFSFLLYLFFISFSEEKRKVSKKRREKISSNNIYIYIILYFIPIVISNNNIESNFSNITLKVNGIGDKYILDYYGNKFPRKNYPNIIYINGENKTTITNHYYFNQTDNFVQLIWYNNIDNCYCMFYYCSDITEIDLSNFDTSNVTSMNGMFQGCSLLSSLNLSNFDTSNVTYMYSMFYGCSLLSSLNLSKVISMYSMFYGCSLLSSLNLSNFDTSNVIYMHYMFYNCSSLKYINLKNFTENKLNSVSNIFGLVPDNVIICLNENSNKIKSQIESKNHIKDCSECGNIREKKIVNKTGICNDNNNNDILYKYEYEGKYYENCLNGYLINESPIINCICNEIECYSNRILFR